MVFSEYSVDTNRFTIRHRRVRANPLALISKRHVRHNAIDKKTN